MVKILICSIAWFGWCKYFHHSWIQVMNIMSTRLQNSWIFNNWLLQTNMSHWLHYTTVFQAASNCTHHSNLIGFFNFFSGSYSLTLPLTPHAPNLSIDLEPRSSSLLQPSKFLWSSPSEHWFHIKYLFLHITDVIFNIVSKHGYTGSLIRVAIDLLFHVISMHPFIREISRLINKTTLVNEWIYSFIQLQT